MKEQLWTVALFPNGEWTTGGEPTSPDYAESEVFRVLATSREHAKKKAQSMRRRLGYMKTYGRDYR